MRSRRNSEIAVILLCALPLASCNSNGCLENRSSLPLAGFYSSSDQPISLDSIEISGIGALDPEPLISAGERISTVYLPMRSTDTSTAWQFAYRYKSILDGQLCDTISFGYSATPYFASYDCGVVYHYRIEQMHHTTHLIDSVIITDSLVTNTDIQRIKIYFRTNDESDEEE